MNRIDLYLRILWLGLGFGFLLCAQSVAEDYHVYVKVMTEPIEVMPQ